MASGTASMTVKFSNFLKVKCASRQLTSCSTSDAQPSPPGLPTAPWQVSPAGTSRAGSELPFMDSLSWRIFHPALLKPPLLRPRAQRGLSESVAVSEAMGAFHLLLLREFWQGACRDGGSPCAPTGDCSELPLCRTSDCDCSFPVAAQSVPRGHQQCTVGGIQGEQWLAAGSVTCPGKKKKILWCWGGS